MASKKAFFVIGPESSGTRLMTSILVEDCGVYGEYSHYQLKFEDKETLAPKFNTHEEQHVAFRRSLPHARLWPNLYETIRIIQDAKYVVTMLILHRDWNAMIQSQVKNGHVGSSSEARFNIKRAYREIFTAINGIGLDYINIVYECLKTIGYVKWLSSELELPFVEKIQVTDENKKYYA